MVKKASLCCTIIFLVIYFWFSKSNTKPVRPSLPLPQLESASNTSQTVSSGLPALSTNTETNINKVTTSSTKKHLSNETVLAEDYIVDCPDEKTTQTDEEREAEKQFISDHWQTSHNPHIRINSAIFALNSTEQEHISKLQQYHELFPNNPMVYDRLLDLCSAKNSHYCSPEFFDKAEQIDKQNGMLLLKIANYYLLNDNKSLAFDYIRQASKLTKFDVYHFHYIENVWRSLKGLLPENQFSFEIAFGYSAALSWNAMSFVDFCKKQTEPNEIDACIAVSQAMRDRGRTGFIQIIGGALELHFAKANNNQAEIDRISQLNKTKINTISDNKTIQAMKLLLNDDSLAEDYLINGKNFGEVETSKLLVKEAIWRSKDPNYNPCQQ